MDDFDVVYREYRPRMIRWSYQYVPGLKPDEVYAEMSTVLWKAWQTFNGTGSFAAYFAACWFRKKSDLFDAFFAEKRRREVLEDFTAMAELAQAYGFELVTECPIDDPDARRLWDFLAAGFRCGRSHSEAVEALGMPRSRIIRLLERFRTDPAVAAALHPA